MIDPFKSKAITRLKKAKGQIDGIIKMIEKDKYDPDIIVQTLAAHGALKSTALLMLESHLHTEGISKLASQNARQKDKFIKELLKVIKVSTK